MRLLTSKAVCFQFDHGAIYGPLLATSDHVAAAGFRNSQLPRYFAVQSTCMVETQTTGQVKKPTYEPRDESR